MEKGINILFTSLTTYTRQLGS